MHQPVSKEIIKKNYHSFSLESNFTCCFHLQQFLFNDCMFCFVSFVFVCVCFVVFFLPYFIFMPVLSWLDILFLHLCFIRALPLITTTSCVDPAVHSCTMFGSHCAPLHYVWTPPCTLVQCVDPDMHPCSMFGSRHAPLQYVWTPPCTHASCVEPAVHPCIMCGLRRAPMHLCGPRRAPLYYVWIPLCTPVLCVDPAGHP